MPRGDQFLRLFDAAHLSKRLPAVEVARREVRIPFEQARKCSIAL
jgi:hypothetical protein